MSSQRYFIIDSDPSPGDAVLLEGSEAHHLARVARVGRGDEATLINGRGGIYFSRVEDFIRDGVRLRIESAQSAPPPLPVDLAVAVIKASRMEIALEKLTELGIRRIVPFISERSIWRGGPDRESKRLQRFRRIVESASKQCGQPWFPEINPVICFDRLADLLGSYDRIFLADPSGLPSAKTKGVRRGEAVLGVIGPEGGFTDREYSVVAKAGIERVSLGKNRLRAETAAVCLGFYLASITD